MSMLRAHLADNRGDENISKMIWIAIVFVVGAILLTVVVGAFKGPITRWFKEVIDSWFNSNTNVNGKYESGTITPANNPWANVTGC